MNMGISAVVKILMLSIQVVVCRYLVLICDGFVLYYVNSELHSACRETTVTGNSTDRATDHTHPPSVNY